MAQPGFMLYVDDWIAYAADYDTTEIGEMVKALISYFTTGEITDFPDRGMRQFFRQGIKAVDRDRLSYEKKCINNAFNRYKQECQKRKEDPLEQDDWYTQIYLVKQEMTNADERQRLSTETTNSNNQPSEAIANSQPSIPVVKEQSEKERESVRGGGKTEPLTDADINELYHKWLNALDDGDLQTAYNVSIELYRMGWDVDKGSRQLSKRHN